MKILVDADACPVKEIILRHAKKYKIELIMLFDTSHVYEDGYSNVIICDTGFDSVDYKLISLTKENDIVVTQDYGLSAMALTKKCKVIHTNGFIIDDNNIDNLLNTRYLGFVSRKADKHIKGPKKREEKDNIKFEETFLELLSLYKLEDEL